MKENLWLFYNFLLFSKMLLLCFLEWLVLCIEVIERAILWCAWIFYGMNLRGFPKRYFQVNNSVGEVVDGSFILTGSSKVRLVCTMLKYYGRRNWWRHPERAARFTYVPRSIRLWQYYVSKTSTSYQTKPICSSLFHPTIRSSHGNALSTSFLLMRSSNIVCSDLCILRWFIRII